MPTHNGFLKVFESFKAGKPARLKNDSTDGRTLRYHGNVIAEKRPEGIFVTDSDYGAYSSTRARLSKMVRVHQKKGVLMIEDKPWDGKFIKATRI